MRDFFFSLLAQTKIKVGSGSGEVEIPKMPMSELVKNGLFIVYTIAGIVAVVIMIMAGYSYLTANGDAEKAKKGLRSILYCSIGLLVVVFAFAITSFVTGRLAK